MAAGHEDHDPVTPAKDGTPAKNATSARRPWWRRTAVWVGGIVAAAATGFLATTFTNIVDWIATIFDTTGPPVEVRVELQDPFEDVVLPSTSALSTDDLANLGQMSPGEQVAWLVVEKDGAVVGTQSVVLTLRGNRADTVRITDLGTAEECDELDRGTLVRMMTGRGAGVDSTRVNIDVGAGSGNAEAYVLDEATGESRPYFPDRTITLARDEELVMIVDLHPGATGMACQVDLELTIWEGDTKHEQSIEGGPFTIVEWEREEIEPEYEAVYLGGELCREYVAAPPRWSSDPASCGPGNLRE